MAISKLILNGEVQMDVTSDTVVANKLLSGETATKNDGTKVTGSYVPPTFSTQTKTVSPTESTQNVTPDTGYNGLSKVTVNPISSTYVGSGIDRLDSADLTVSGATVSAPAGYYSEAASKSVASGSATTPATTVTANPTISVSSGGLITATASATKSVTPTVSAGYVSSGTAGTITVSGSKTSQLSTQAATTITPTESEQTAVTAGKYTTGAVKVGAISSTYVGSGIDRLDDTDLTVSGATVTVPSGYYAESETATVASGTAGTPTATKGTVSNNSIAVTPKVTNTTGYITGGTKTGTAVTVSASELVSGTKSISANGTGIDVTNYKNVNVSVDAPEPVLQTKTATYTPTTSKQTATITADSDYDGLDEVDITVNAIQTETKSATPTESAQTITPTSGKYLTSVSVGAISSTYVGSGVTQRSSTDLTASGATITAPSGYYPDSASKSVATMTLPTTTSTSATSGYTAKATLDRSTSDRYLNISPGYNSAGGYYKINKVANGSVTAPSSISGTSATVSTGTNTLTLTKSVSVTPNVITAGYISSGTAGNSSVSLTASVTTKGASTITPSTSEQSIAAGTYLTGKQTISAMPSGTAGTPTATKGTVSDHSISVTPSVTNTTGYITGGTKTGTAVSVSASELVSGTWTASEDGEFDVTNYKNVSIPQGAVSTPGALKGTVSNNSISVTPYTTVAQGWVYDANKTGTAVSVSASELVSGTISIGSNGTGIDVTNYASADVNVTPRLTGKTVVPTDSVQVITPNDSDDATLTDISLQNSSGETATATVSLPIVNGKTYRIYGQAKYTRSALYTTTMTFDDEWVCGEPLPYTESGDSPQSPTVTLTPTQLSLYALASLNFTLKYLAIIAFDASYNGLSSVIVSPISGGDATVVTDSITFSSSTSTDVTFSNIKKEPQAFSLRLADNLSTTSSTYYYITSIVYNGTNTKGNYWRSGNGYFYNAAKYSWTYTASTKKLQISSSGSRTTAGGSFHNSTYELICVY